jgi:hypothetical protein
VDEHDTALQDIRPVVQRRRSLLDKLADTLNTTLDDENTRKRRLEFGSDIPEKAHRGQQPLAALVKNKLARWTPIIKAANIRAE